MTTALLLMGLLVLPVQKADDWCVARGMRLRGHGTYTVASTGKLGQSILCRGADYKGPSTYAANPDFPQWQPTHPRRVQPPSISTRTIYINGRMITVRTYGR